MYLRRCQPSESRATALWVKELHYLQSTPPGFVHVLEFVDGRTLIGAMILGRPGPRELDADKILELTRVYFLDEAPKNTESQALAMMRKHVRTWLPGIRLLLAYSDPAQGHVGKIYESHHVSKALVARYNLIAHEDLKITRMVHGNLGKSILDAAWGQLLFQLAYKAEKAGRYVIAVNPRGTSQRCSGCGENVPKELSERWHLCPHCGLSLGRDHNAALNILALAPGRGAVDV